MDLEFSGAVFQWRGPSPYYYVAVPDDESDDIRDIATAVTYGWGVIPVEVTIGVDGLDDVALPQGRALPGAAQGQGTTRGGDRRRRRDRPPRRHRRP